MQKLYIPKKLKIGFQNRQGTYTGKLAYVVYHDDTGKLRKEPSWNKWRDKSLPTLDLDNTPQDGFVLNKRAGGGGGYWGHRDTYVRVWDPRGPEGFEFEIEVPNLLFILQQYDCSRGKGLEGKFVYAWDGVDLVLLPVESEEYRKSLDFTTLQSKTLSARDLVVGAQYSTKQGDTYTFLGRFTEYRPIVQSFELEKPKTNRRIFLFWDGSHFRHETSLSKFACCVGESLDPNTSDLIERFNRSPYGSKPVRLLLAPKDDLVNRTHRGTWGAWSGDTLGEFSEHHIGLSNPSIEIIRTGYYRIIDNVVRWHNSPAVSRRYPQGNLPYRFWGFDRVTIMEMPPKTNDLIWVELESGAIYRLTGGGLTYEDRKQHWAK